MNNSFPEHSWNCADFPALRAAAKAAAKVMRFPFHKQIWRGAHGNWAGAGVGSSIDFHDHRPYVPGDDPRLINWQAYARTGQYSMKLFREEVCPEVDIALDCSLSMIFEAGKRDRVLEIFYFAIENALASGSSIRIFAASANRVEPITLQAALGNDLAQLDKFIESANASGSPKPLDLGAVLFRQYALRVLISDLLFPGSPCELLRALAKGKGRGIMMVPYCASEADPKWAGNCEMVDCETGRTRRMRMDGASAARYRSVYEHHFGLWREEAKPHGISMARIPADKGLTEALKFEGLSSGAVEPCR